MKEKWWKTRLIFLFFSIRLFHSFHPLSWNVHPIFWILPYCFPILIRNSVRLIDVLFFWPFFCFVLFCFPASRLICWQMRSRVYQFPGGHASRNPHWSRIGWRPRSTSVAVWRLQSRCRVGQQDGEQRATRVSLSACLKTCFSGCVYVYIWLPLSLSFASIHP